MIKYIHYEKRDFYEPKTEGLEVLADTGDARVSKMKSTGQMRLDVWRKPRNDGIPTS